MQCMFRTQACCFFNGDPRASSTIMNRFTNTLRTLVPAAVISFASLGYSQTPGDQQPTVFRIEVVSRTTKAINYHHRQGSTTVTLAGSTFAPKGKGEVRVDSKTGATKVDATIEKMPPASSLAEGYLTYVLWAITPEGRAENMGELMLEGDHARLQGATELQTFGMIVTAEPYYAVTQPSDYVVMEGVINKDTTGTIMPIESKYELVARGGYLQQLPPADRVRLREARNIPLDLMEARQAVAVARAAGADRYALDTMKKADVDLYNAEAFLQSGQDKKKIQSLARHVTQLSEDARLISVRKTQEESLSRERSENERRTTELTRTAENEADRRRNAEMEAAQKNREALLAQQQAADARRNAEQVQAQSDATIAAKDRQLALETERARIASATADAERVKQQNSELEAAKAREQAIIAQREREESTARQRTLEQEAARARESAQAIEQKNKELEEQAKTAQEVARRAEDERTRARGELERQLNVVLVTRQTARA